MATEVLAGGIGEIRAMSTASGGTALTTTATYIPIALNANHVYITPRNFATAVVAKFSLNPWLTIMKTADWGFTFTDYSNNAQDGDATTTVALYALDTLANGDSFLIGAHVPFRGVYITLPTTNDTASTLSVFYRKSDNTWADSSATDGTDAAGDTLKTTPGLVYWTVPTDWIPAKLTDIFSGARLVDATGTYTGSPIYLKPGSNTVAMSVAGTATVTLPTGATGVARTSTATLTGSPVALVAGANTLTTTGGAGNILVEISGPPCTGANVGVPLFWTQWSVSAAIDSCTASSMYAANRSTAYAELLSGQSFETQVHTGRGGFGCVEALVNAGTGNLIVNAATNKGGGF